MSKTGWALVFKFVMTFVIALLTLSLFDDNTWSSVFLYSIIATAANYLIGDLIILPSMGNTVASIADGGMAAAVGWLMSMAMAGFRATFATLVALAILVAIGEYFFHGYLKNTREVAP